MAGSGRDFPFYDGRPDSPSALRWGIALASVAAGTAALLYSPRLFAPNLQIVGILLFVALPLAGLAVLCRGRLGLVLRPPTAKDLVIGVGFGLLNLVVTVGVGYAVSTVLPTAANPINAVLESLPPAGIPVTFGQIAVQLLGEELVTVIPFLAVLALASRLGAGRGLAVALAAVAAALFFAALHFPTYQWHIAQTVLIIGSARLVLLAAYLVTKTLWASTVAHILNDWTLFAVAIALMHAAR